MELTTPASPRLISLSSELANGHHTAVEQFWREVEEQGAPLIEDVGADGQQRLVTFLWRGRSMEADPAVELVSALVEVDNSQPALTRLDGTDIWYKTCNVRSDYRGSYRFGCREAPDEGQGDRNMMLLPDPLNPRAYTLPADAEGNDRRFSLSSLLELPAAPTQPWVVPQGSTPHGAVDAARLRSAMLGNERRVWVYTPPGYAAAAALYPLLLLFDGWAYTHIVPTPTILDNLIAAGALPPMVAVLPDSLDNRTRNHELTGHEHFVTFLAEELLPWARTRYRLTNDPAKTVVAGSSFGGLAAAHAALRRPDLFGNVLSQSGAFRWAPPGDKEMEWMVRPYIVSPRLPLRFYLDIGRFEVATFGAGINRLVANRHFRDILRAKGYPLHYAEYSGGHEYLCWQGTLADGLLALLGTQGSSFLRN